MVVRTNVLPRLFVRHNVAIEQLRRVPRTPQTVRLPRSSVTRSAISAPMDWMRWMLLGQGLAESAKVLEEMINRSNTPQCGLPRGRGLQGYFFSFHKGD